ncbi:MAG: hypothetical protein WA364_10850 [Candidatus Nitrosopolaris sp.]
MLAKKNWGVDGPRHKSLTPPGGLDYRDLHKWVRRNRTGPSGQKIRVCIPIRK